jgi:hypothetical protein
MKIFVVDSKEDCGPDSYFESLNPDPHSEYGSDCTSTLKDNKN